MPRVVYVAALSLGCRCVVAGLSPKCRRMSLAHGGMCARGRKIIKRIRNIIITKVWREKTSASRVLAALASSPATKALDPDPFPRHSLRHAVYAALLHFGFETAIIKIIKKCLYLARKRLSATNRRQPSDKPATTQRQYREVATQTWLKLLHGLAPRRWRQHPWLRALLRLLLRCPHGQLHVFAVQLRPAA